MGEMESQGISRVGHTVLVRLTESQIWHLPACSCWGRAQKGTCSPFYLRENCPPALVLMPDTSVHPHMPLVPFNCYPNAGVQRE